MRNLDHIENRKLVLNIVEKTGNLSVIALDIIASYNIYRYSGEIREYKIKIYFEKN